MEVLLRPIQYGWLMKHSSSPPGAVGLWLIGALLWATLGTASAQIAPRYLPHPGDLLLHDLPTQLSVPLTTSVNEGPHRLEQASTQARRLFLAALDQGDPRLLGYAQALLAPWWDQVVLPAETLFVRALIRQGLHDFEAARLDLNRAIAAEPDRPEFWSWLFAVDLVGARMAQARTTCDQIRNRFGSVEGDACQGVLLYRTGRPREALAILDRLAQRPDAGSATSAQWLAFHRGEARRLSGQVAAALEIWRRGLGSEPGGHGLRLAMVELLNDQGRYAEALQLNAQLPRSDALLVQAIRSAAGLGQRDQAAVMTRALRERLARQTARGDMVNERPVVVFWLDIAQEPAKALALARLAWTTQREPADAVLFGRAALLTKDRLAAATVSTWLRDTGYVDEFQKPLFDAVLALAGEAGRP